MQEKKNKESRDERQGWAWACECRKQDCAECQKAFQIKHFKPTNPGRRERNPQRIEQEAVVRKKHPTKKAPKEIEGPDEKAVRLKYR